MTTNERCLFCRIAIGDIPAKKIHDDEHVVAFEDINPQAPTHILVIPRAHVASLDAMTDAHEMAVGRAIHRAAIIARDRHLNQEGYRVVINNGEAAGQTVFHIHVHLLGGRNFGWPPG